MTPLQAALQHLANLLVAVTGVLYFIAAHLLESDDPFAVVGHPWQPALQHAHVLVAPLLVFATGMLWSRHVAPRLSAPEVPRRLSGLALVLSFGPMVASGYLLQVSVDEWWRVVWTWTHVGASVTWLLGYGAHLASKAAARRREASSR